MAVVVVSIGSGNEDRPPRPQRVALTDDRFCHAIGRQPYGIEAGFDEQQRDEDEDEVAKRAGGKAGHRNRFGRIKADEIRYIRCGSLTP